MKFRGTIAPFADEWFSDAGFAAQGCGNQTPALSELGLDACGITPADPSAHAAFFRTSGPNAATAAKWRGWPVIPSAAAIPASVLPGARSLIVAGLNYWQPARTARGRIARYALGDDYHDILMEKLRVHWRMKSSPTARPQKSTSTPVPCWKSRSPPAQASAGRARAPCSSTAGLGPWLLLGEIITTLELEPDTPERDHCGTCSRCLDACPTRAITAPYQLDARRCIAYLTIELKGSIPVEMRPLIGDRVYGCDECLDVCPWNRFAQATRETRFHRAGRPAQR